MHIYIAYTKTQTEILKTPIKTPNRKDTIFACLNPYLVHWSWQMHDSAGLQA